MSGNGNEAQIACEPILGSNFRILLYTYIYILYTYIYYTFVEFPKPLVTSLQSTVASWKIWKPPSVLSGEGALDRRHDHGGGGLEEKHGAGVHHPAASRMVNIQKGMENGPFIDGFP